MAAAAAPRARHPARSAARASQWAARPALTRRARSASHCSPAACDLRATTKRCVLAMVSLKTREMAKVETILDGGLVQA